MPWTSWYGGVGADVPFVFMLGRCGVRCALGLHGREVWGEMCPLSSW